MDEGSNPSLLPKSKSIQMKNAIKDNRIDPLTDVMIDFCYPFRVDKHWFNLYYPSLGKIKRIERLCKQLEFDLLFYFRPTAEELLKVIQKQKDIIVRIITIHTFQKKEDVLDEKKLRSRISFFIKHLDDKEIAKLFLTTLSLNDITGFMESINIQENNKKKEIVSNIKNDKDSTLTIGASTEYGNLIDRAAERYGWTMEYIVWGISYANLILLLADSPVTIYLTEKERKKLPRSFFSKNYGEIDMNDPKSLEIIKQMDWK